MARIQAKLSTAGRQSASLVIGIGDDAAVVAPTRNAQTVLTTDALVEGVHFDRRFSSPEDIGYRALAVNLSDLAAMGAAPAWALLSLILPADLLVSDVEAIVTGIAGLGRQFGCEVIGGNVTESPGPLVVDVTAVGEVRPRRVLTRGGGRAGDGLWVSGSIGAAAAGLEMLKAGAAGDCIARYLRPEPRVRLGRAVAQAGAARAAMDLSDGLADAARQLAEASGCGVEIDAEALPIEPAARAWWEAVGQDAVLHALSGGDDYELLFAVPRTGGGRLRHARSRVEEPALTRIGVLTKDAGVRVLLRQGARESLPRGFEHF
ncbi:MAG TPA: thiamine-phosphate kinase [Vicinamibacterales bacterium]|nr:thiamine-phosphate kinase [Vicinamibacterales bacterium]